MKHFNFISAVVCFFILSSTLSAQGYYLNKGESAFGFGAGFASNDEASTIIAKGGYSFSAFFDIEFNYSHSILDENIYGYKISANGIGVVLTCHLLKEKLPVSLAASFGYQRNFYVADALADLNVNMNADIYTFGGSLYKKIFESESFFLIPRFGIYYRARSIELNDNTGNSFYDDKSNYNYSFSADVVFILSGNQMICVSPSITTNENDMSYRVGVSYILK